MMGIAPEDGALIRNGIGKAAVHRDDNGDPPHREPVHTCRQMLSSLQDAAV